MDGSHEKADLAAVVSNQSYTPSAKALGASNGVVLLHYTDLAKDDLADRLGGA